jgi:hypothetical protein
MLTACGDQSAPAEVADTPPPARTFTPQEFRTYAYMRTKAQIRAEFGSPDFVFEPDDSWSYFAGNSRLIVVDPDAGRKVSANIQFEGIPGPQDPALQVTY